MRRIRMFLAVTAFSVALTPQPVAAHHRPNLYCGETGDICQSTRKVDSIRRLQMHTFAKYFDRYRLCVKAPNGTRTCRRFRMVETEGGSFASSVRWRRHFPSAGTGAYTVTWRALGSQIGRRLGFHVR